MTDDGMKTGHASEGGHWYTQDGRAAYELPLVKPAKDGRTHTPTTLRHARELGLLWSVTTIAGACDKPALIRWKEGQVFDAVHDSDQWEDYMAGRVTKGEFRRRAMERAAEKAKTAAERGTSIHTAAESAICGRDYPAEFRPHVGAIFAELARFMGADRIDINDWDAEAVVVHRSGYGGKCDIRHRSLPIIVDLKSKDMDADTKLAVYDEHLMQCAALAQASGWAGTARCANIFVSRGESGFARLIEHAPGQIAKGLQMFNALLAFKVAQTGHNAAF